MDTCPLCGSKGVDVVFSFYCFNTECKNYRETEEEKEDKKRGKEMIEKHIADTPQSISEYSKITRTLKNIDIETLKKLKQKLKDDKLC